MPTHPTTTHAHLTHRPSSLLHGTSRRWVAVVGSAATTSTYRVAQQLETVGHPDGSITTSTWDPNGNLATETTGADVTSYEWDAENQVREITEPSSAVSSYLYRADKRRSVQENDSDTQYLIWDGNNCLLELDSGLVLLADYAGLPGEWGGLASMRRSASSSYYGFDMQWSARQLVTAAEAVSDEYWRDAFGVELATTGTTVNPYRYVGAYGYRRENAVRDDVWHRMLRRDLGRWMSVDPFESVAANVGSRSRQTALRALGVSKSADLYGYVFMRPVMLLDPSGLVATSQTYTLWLGQGSARVAGWSCAGVVTITTSDCDVSITACALHGWCELAISLGDNKIGRAISDLTCTAIPQDKDCKCVACKGGWGIHRVAEVVLRWKHTDFLGLSVRHMSKSVGLFSQKKPCCCRQPL